jgi:hypothetical protein
MFNSNYGQLVGMKFFNPRLFNFSTFYYYILCMHLNEFRDTMKDHICVIMVKWSIEGHNSIRM